MRTGGELSQALATEDEALRLVTLARGAFRRTWLLEVHTQSASTADAERIAATVEALDRWWLAAERLFPSAHERIEDVALAESPTRVGGFGGTAVEVALSIARDAHFSVAWALMPWPDGAPTDEQLRVIRALQTANVQPPPRLPEPIPVEVVRDNAERLVEGWANRVRLDRGDIETVEDCLDRLRRRLGGASRVRLTPAGLAEATGRSERTIARAAREAGVRRFASGDAHGEWSEDEARRIAEQRMSAIRGRQDAGAQRERGFWVERYPRLMSG